MYVFYSYVLLFKYIYKPRKWIRYISDEYDFIFVISNRSSTSLSFYPGTLIRSGRICIFKSCRKSSFSDFLVVLVFESMHVVGLALLFFVVLPELDVVKGAMLTNCVAFIPAVLGKRTRSELTVILDKRR